MGLLGEGSEVCGCGVAIALIIMSSINALIKRYFNQIFQMDRIIKIVDPSYILLSWLWPYYYTVIILPEPAAELRAKLLRFSERDFTCLLYNQWWIDRNGLWGCKAEFRCKAEDGRLSITGPLYGPTSMRSIFYNTRLTVTEHEEASSALAIESYLSVGYLLVHALFSFALFMLTWFILLSGTEEEPFRNAPAAVLTLIIYLGSQINYRMFINEVYRFIEDYLLVQR